MKIKTRDLTMTTLFTALTCIGAFISIPIGPVPITLQTFFVIMSGLILGARLGALSQIVYVLLGLIGLPIFTGGTGGIIAITKPTFGFLLGFIVAAYIVGKISETNKSLKTIIFATVLGSIIIYLLGIPYFYLIFTCYLGKTTTLLKTLSYTLIPFIPGDLLKAFLAILLAKKLFTTLPWLKKIK